MNKRELHDSIQGSILGYASNAITFDECVRYIVLRAELYAQKRVTDQIDSTTDYVRSLLQDLG